MSRALAASVAAGSAATFFLPGLLSGPEAMNGSARGTALIMLIVGAPALLGAMLLARRSDRAVIVWLGTSAYLAYNAVMLLLATPFNQLFLLYVAMLSLSLAAIATLCAHLDVTSLAKCFATNTQYGAWRSPWGRSSTSTRWPGCEPSSRRWVTRLTHRSFGAPG
ncbi:hypothetical protein [Nonomuraea endophytica]|uniref:hypothetical protein n=1 Tax=Nonomuraea endophytica TaxID=714136 RepID=UPI0037C63A64